MTAHTRSAATFLALTALTVVLAGCASSTGGPEAPSHASAPAVMATSGPMTMPMPAATSAAAPLAAAKMGCSEETQGNIAKIFSLAHPQKPQALWSHTTYTCTYNIPNGTLRLSVKQSKDDSAARAYFAGQQKNDPTAQSIEGLNNLGLPAYQTTGGHVSFVKDNLTLLVDTSTLAAPLPAKASRTQLAYEIATAVLACWSK